MMPKFHVYKIRVLLASGTILEFKAKFPSINEAMSYYRLSYPGCEIILAQRMGKIL